MEFQVSGSTIILGNKPIHDFKYKILAYLALGDRIIVAVDLPASQSEYNRNVFCVDFYGNILWQIENKKYPESDCPGNNLYMKDEAVKLYRWCGVEETINPNTGGILNSELIK